PECLTQGETLDEAYEMASDAVGLCIDERLKNKEELPPASAPTDVDVEKDDFACLIEFDLSKYRRKHNTKAVKKTLTIPEWLNEIATSQNINFSQVLQEALMQKVGML
nr:type II toxin-antitoxin system HicB family antitoxin [Lachnospiraceae bacterium]